MVELYSCSLTLTQNYNSLKKIKKEHCLIFRVGLEGGVWVKLVSCTAYQHLVCIWILFFLFFAIFSTHKTGKDKKEIENSIKEEGFVLPNNLCFSQLDILCLFWGDGCNVLEEIFKTCWIVTLLGSTAWINCNQNCSIC